MGIVAKQTLKGSIWSYLGVLIGALNVAYLMPRILHDDEIGLLNILVALATVFAQFSSLGINGVTNYFFPYFKNKKERNNGYFLLMNTVILIGFILFCILFFFFDDTILTSKSNDSFLLFNYKFYFYPLTLFTLLFLSLDKYNSMLLDSVTGTFLKELFVRIFNTGSILLFHFHYINFDWFLFIYIATLALPSIVVFFVLLFRNEISFKKPNRLLFDIHRSKMLSVGFYSIVSGFGGIIMIFIDKYMINYYLGLSLTGIYSICAYVATLILIPGRSVQKIGAPLISEAWKKNDMKYLQNIFLKTSVYQLVFGFFIFILIWINIDNIFHIIPERFSEGKWTIFFLGLSYLLMTSSNLSNPLIQTSSKYKFASYFIYLMILLVIISNIIFIPIMGLNGAAFASFIAMFISVLIRTLFIYKSFQLKQYSFDHLKVVFVSLILIILFTFIPYLSNFIFDGIIRSAILILLYFGSIFMLKIVPEINSKINQKLKNILVKFIFRDN